ncbi:unnamed protein product [Linum tenue]|uniref:Electron transfer flavoprotein-ubiquinone oxidoreductase n=1 Tax=Linum tenue TaxID=586396 RepID=A0AAV0IHQ3_9ROSI|nr:unnamed protein product [Linum tenue]
MNSLASFRPKSRIGTTSSSSSSFYARLLGSSIDASRTRSPANASDSLAVLSRCSSLVPARTLTGSSLFGFRNGSSASLSNLTGCGGNQGVARRFCSDAAAAERESMEYDVVIVGAGPAGLSAAIRLKQLCGEKGVDLSVCIVEKGAEVGAHIISGNVFEPRALDELLPEWKKEEVISSTHFPVDFMNSLPIDAPISVSVSSDKFWFLKKDRAFSLPSPFDNKNNYVISLSQLVRWLGSKAEEYGVEIYPGFAASEKIIKKYNLREKRNAQHQTYALGIKEVWEIDESKHQPGAVIHTLGWPLDQKTYGGSFLYHMSERQVAICLVVALNYKNPYLSPYDEFQKLKHHPAIKPILEDGTVVQYGARTLNEGGIQSIPYPVFPGGAIIGCSAGFLNVPKIKGTHTAMKSGMLAAEAAFGTLLEGSNLDSYWTTLQNSWVWEELHKARNYRPVSENFTAVLFFLHLIMGLFLEWPSVQYNSKSLASIKFSFTWIHSHILISFLPNSYLFRGKSPFTLKHGKPDHEATNVARSHSPIEYPKPDGVLSFDVPTSLHRSNTNHDHDQPAHLKLRDPEIPTKVNLPEYDGPESRYCPARVYEYVPEESGQLKLQINAQNCLHCKACDIKDPKQNIEWTVPEGGGGPGYSVM